uniref:Zinc finger, CCHC-type n=1 Tax=Tanacetum cinerariifolium TaxID=118510 RepID=A0A6L2L8W6_TANCI|nr:zinc finger, CCHC-type [Tanacetum cinerariifolium]
MQVLYGFEFKVERLRDHTFEVEPQENVDQGVGLQEMCMCSAMVAGNAVKTTMAITGSMHQVQNFLEGHSILSLEGSLSRDCDVKNNCKWSFIYAVGSQEYQMVCTRLDIASADVGILDKFDHALQTDVQVFVDFDYGMRRSIIVMSRSITGYGLMILGCVGSLKANLQHMEALSTAEARYITFTEARKKEIWLKGLLIESGYELRLVAGMASGVLVKGGSRYKVPAQVEVVAYRMSVVYVLTTHIPEDGENATMEQIRKRNKWDNDDYVSRGLILNVVNMIEHNNSFMYNDNKGKCKHQDTKADPNKKFKVTCWKCGKPGHLKKNHKGGKVGDKANGSGTNGLVNGSFNSLKDQNMFHKSFQVYYVTYVSKAYFVQDDDVAWWVDSGAIMHVCKDRYWFKTYESLNNGSILHMRNDSTALVNGHGYVDLRFSYGKIVSLFNVLHVPNIRKNLVLCSILNNCGYKQMIESNKFVLSKHGVFIGFGYLGNQMFRLNIVNDNIASAFMAVVRLPDLKLQTLDESGIECIFIGYAEHSKAFSPYTKSKSLINKTEDIDGSVVLKEVTKEVVTQQPKPKPRKSKRNRTLNKFGPKFQLYLIEETRDDISNQHSYCFNVGDDPKTFDTTMKSHDVAFWKEAINDEIKLKVDGTIEKFKARLVIQGFRQKLRIDCFDTYALVARISTLRLLIDMASIHNTIIHQMNVKTTFLNGELDEEVDLAKEFLSSKFTMKDMREADVILGVRIKHESNIIAISQSHYIEKVLKKLNYFDCTPMSTPIDTSEKLMTNNGHDVSQLEYSRVTGCLMCVMTCTRPDIDFVVGKLISSTMESEFVALAATDKEDEWLRNLILEIPLWSKPIAHISIRFDSAPTMAKAYSQMYSLTTYQTMEILYFLVAPSPHTEESHFASKNLLSHIWGCNGLRGKSSKFGVVVACGGGVAFGKCLLFGSSYDGELVVPRFNVTLTSCGGEVVVVLVGEDSLDDLRLMWLDGLTLIRVVCRYTWVEDEAKLRVAKYRNLQSKNRRSYPSTSCCQTKYSRYQI